MKYITPFLIIVFLLVISVNVFAQSTNWEEYGLSEEVVKNLTEEEKQEILNSKTPVQLQTYFEDGIKDGSINPEEVPPPLLYLLDQNATQEIKLSDEVVSCFDYYTFGSVEVDIQSRSSLTVSGTDMTFFGTVTNKNPYPVVEGTLYVKIMKNIGDEKDPNGPDVVDQFIAVDNVNLKANGTVPMEFTWKVPTYTTTGDYRVVTYFTSDKKFNLQGLSFTDDIVGNSFDFKVSGEQEEIISFDKSSVVINNNPYYFAAYPPRIQKGEQTNISLEVLNNTSTDQSSEINWKLYKWDAMNPENLIREFTTGADTKAESLTNIQLSIPEDTEPVYLLVGELLYKDTKSIVNIRFVRDGVDKVRLNYPAVTSYPLKEGEQTTLFTCLHNSGQSSQVSNNKVILEVKDEKGKVMESYTYEGVVTGDMIAVKKDFTPKTNLDKFSVHASVYTNGEIVDQSVMEYDCALIDPSSCSEKTASSTTQIIIGFITLILFILIIIFLKRKTKGIEVVVLLFILSGSLLLFDARVPSLSAQTPLPANLVNPKVTNKSRQVVWNDTLLESLAYHWSNNSNVTSTKCLTAACNNPSGGWVPGLKNPNITVKYNSKIINIDTGQEIQSGANVPVDTKLKLQFIAHHPYDIYWFGTGYSIDSPYGEWRDNPDAVPQIDTCKEKDYLNFINFSAENISGIYVPLLIDSPNKNLRNSNLTCTDLSEDAGGNYQAICEIVAPGPVSADFIFKATTGNFYYRYKKGSSCIGNNLALRKNLSSKNEWYHTVVGSKPFTLNVPTQTISYTLNAIALPVTNTAPTISITGATTGIVGTTYPFTFNASDSESDKVKIEIDWNNNGTGDQFLPTGTEEFVSSPTIQQGTKNWTTIGTKIIKARAIDKFGAASAWSTHTIILENTQSYILTFDGNGATSGSTANQSIESGTSAALRVNGFVRTGYLFAGWATSAGGAVVYNNQANYIMGNANATLYAKWDSDPSVSPFTISCSADSVTVDEFAVFKAKPLNNPGTVSYQWKEEDGVTNISGAINQNFSRKYTTIDSYKLYIEAKSQGITVSNSCNVTVGCDGTHYEGKAATACDASGQQNYYTCTSSGWTSVGPRGCGTPITDPVATFSFAPNIIANSSEKCGLTLNASNVASCTLISLSGNISVPVTGTSISLTNSRIVPVGRYTLSCIGLGTSPVTKQFGMKSCIVNPDIKEN